MLQKNSSVLSNLSEAYNISIIACDVQYFYFLCSQIDVYVNKYIKWMRYSNLSTIKFVQYPEKEEGYNASWTQSEVHDQHAVNILDELYPGANKIVALVA